MVHRRSSLLLVLITLLLVTSSSYLLPGVAHSEVQNESFNFIAYGDTRSSNADDAVSPVHATLVNSYLQRNPDFILHTGDMVMRGGVWDQWLLFNASIAAVWNAGTPLYGVVGNHEKYTDDWYVYDDDFSNYRAFFDFSSVVDEPGETELYYSFDYQGIHVIILNTEDYFDDIDDEFTCSPAQMNWLIADLNTTDPDDFIVAAYHRPSWSVRAERPDRWAQAETVRDDFHDLFVQYDVDIVFSGHDHQYYRALRDGIYYVITGGGGAPLYGVDETAPHWQAGDVGNNVHHYCHVEVTPTHVYLTAYMIDGTAIDSFSIPRINTLPIPPLPIELIIISICIILIVIVVVVFLIRRRRV